MSVCHYKIANIVASGCGSPTFKYIKHTALYWPLAGYREWGNRKGKKKNKGEDATKAEHKLTLIHTDTLHAQNTK